MNSGAATDFSQHQYVVQQQENGFRYEGYKLNGKKDGYGKVFYKTGGFYEGNWKNDKMEGWGRLFYDTGKLAYEGNWCQGQFHGFGKVYNDNPKPLQNGFAYTDFDHLSEQWEYYEGMLFKDAKEGKGKIRFTNGEIFEGQFHNDRVWGPGKFFTKDDKIIEGVWNNSKLISPLNPESQQ